MNIQKEMTRDEFKQLNFTKKLNTIWSSGDFIDSHITSVGESRIINLYKINKFYVEIVYEEIATKIKEINCYKFGQQTENYLPAV